MLTDPQSVSLAGAATSFVKTSMGPNQSVFVSPDGAIVMTVKQNKTKSRNRREVRLAYTVIAADPISTLNVSKSSSVYLVIDEPDYGISDTQNKVLIDALKAWLTTANQDKILFGEF